MCYITGHWIACSNLYKIPCSLKKNLSTVFETISTKLRLTWGSEPWGCEPWGSWPDVDVEGGEFMAKRCTQQLDASVPSRTRTTDWACVRRGVLCVQWVQHRDRFVSAFTNPTLEVVFQFNITEHNTVSNHSGPSKTNPFLYLFKQNKSKLWNMTMWNFYWQ
jgi:hypothetical protein